MQTETTEALELLPALKRRWGGHLRKSLRSLLLRQNDQWVDVKLRFRSGAERHYFLGFICIGPDPLFSPDVDIVDNAQAFLMLDVITLSQCIGGLFRSSFCREMREAASPFTVHYCGWYNDDGYPDPRGPYEPI